MNLEEIKKQIAELVIQVDELAQSQQTGGDYVFTQEQMIKFVEKMHENFLVGAKSNIEDNCSIDEDVIELSMYDKTIEVEINQSQIFDLIADAMDQGFDEDEITTDINIIYKQVKA